MIGDDVIDLRDEECRTGARHPRFDARVFCEAERACLADLGGDERLRWLLFAAKESALKALRRVDARLVFSPPRFVVRIDRRDARGASGQIAHPDGLLHFVARTSGSLVHAVAWLASYGSPRVIDGISRLRAGEAPTEAARRLACTRVAVALGLAPGSLDIVRESRRPAFVRGNERLDATLTLSHHGRFVSFACAPGTPVSARRAA